MRTPFNFKLIPLMKLVRDSLSKAKDCPDGPVRIILRPYHARSYLNKVYIKDQSGRFILRHVFYDYYTFLDAQLMRMRYDFHPYYNKCPKCGSSCC